MSAIRYPLRTTTLAAAICATLGGFPVQVAMAQEAGASQQQTHTFNIPAGPLEQALVQLSSATGTTVSFTPDRVKGIEAPALKGAYTAQSALSRVLAGSGLVAQALPNGSYSVQPMAANMLKPVTVSAAGGSESAYGPVDGYVATRSASGTKTDALLIETPQSISVVTADQMKKQGADTLAEALQYTPNIAPLDDGDINGLSFAGLTMRGFNVTGSAPLYVNGSRFPVNSFSAAEQPYLFERVEVLRGPASVLYGEATPGGIINLVTKQPTLKRVRELKLVTDSYGSAQANVDAGGRLTEDGKWSYRVTGLVRDGETRIDEVPDDRRVLQAGLKWSPTDDTDLTMTGTYQRNETVYNLGKPEDGSILPNPNGEYDPNVFLGEPGFDNYDAERFTLGYLLEHRFIEGWKARQSVLWYDADINWAYLFPGDPDPVDRRMISRFPTARSDSDQGWSIDNQLIGELQHGRFMHTVLAGLSYSESEFRREQAKGTVDPIDGFDPVYGAPVVLSPTETTDNKSTQLGVYMQDQITFADKWVALIGGRWDDVEIKDKLAGSTTLEDSAFTYRTGLVRLFDNGVAPYISYSQSFQSQSGSDFSGKSFEPTEGEQYEAGVKYEPPGANAMVMVSVFDITQQNVVTSDLDNPGFSEQTGEVQSKGYEVEAKIGLNQLDLIASYAFVDAEVTKSNSGNEGNVPTSAPRHTAALWADYRLASGILSGINLGGGVQYTGESYNLDNSIKVPSYTVVNAAVGYEYDRWQFDLNVNNLLGEEYIARCTFNCFYGAERSAELAVTYSW